MEVVKNGNIIEVDGVIKTMNDVSKLNEVLDEFNEGGSVIFKIKNSFAMPSALIGNFLKKTQEGVVITLEVGNNILYEVLDDLNLVNKLNVRKI